MIKRYKSIVDSDIKKHIREADWAEDLIQYALYKCEIDGLIAAGALFCPEFVCVKDYVFVRKFMNCEDEQLMEYTHRLEVQNNYSKKEIEKCVNSWSLGDFFVGVDTEVMNNDDVIEQFGELLCYFWNLRVKQLFPDKSIIVKLEHEIMGEFGLCITMYEDECS